MNGPNSITAIIAQAVTDYAIHHEVEVDRVEVTTDAAHVTRFRLSLDVDGRSHGCDEWYTVGEKHMKHPLQPGESYGLGHGGYPPASVIRDPDGKYYLDRLRKNLKDLERKEISAEEASQLIRDDEEFDE